MAGLRILSLNAGSSSVKASVFDLTAPGPDGDAPSGLLWSAESGSERSLEQILAGLWTGVGAPLARPDDIDVIGHRVVHGGATLLESTLVTPAVQLEIASAAEYAPEHNAAALAFIDQASRLFGRHLAQVAVFDTAFHRTMPPAAFTYPGPHAWLEQGIRRHGFHGVSHAYVAHRAERMLGRARQGFRVVSCHLGSGCSLAAVQHGRSVDTTMGFTPLDGIPMARRSGALDPGILIHLLRHGGHTPDSLDRLLTHDAGLAGLSGTSGDMREVLHSADAGHERARLALDVFVHRVRQGIASMAAAMDGVDVIVFTGGVGEHAPRVRGDICAGLGFLGVTIDAQRNAAIHGEGIMSSADSRVSLLVIPAEENWMIARACVRVLGMTP